MRAGAGEGGVDHPAPVVATFRQSWGNPLENAAFAPASQPLAGVLPIAEAPRKVAPGDAGPVAMRRRLDKRAIVGGRARDLALPAGKPILDPIPSIVPQTMTTHRQARQNEGSP